MVRENQSPHVNRARRHFLGLAAAAAARIAAIGTVVSTLPNSMAEAAPGNAKGKGKGKGKGNGPGGIGGPMCLLSGTAVLTPRGEVCIEHLRIGDLVETVRGEMLPVKWIGRHVYRRSSPIWNKDVVPIRIRRFALDGCRPHRDLYLSRGHALYIDGVLIRAQDLINGTSITPALPDTRDTIEYYQIVFATHEVVLAEGAPVESFLLEDANYEGFTNFVEFARLYPSDHEVGMVPFAPIVGHGGREHLKALIRIAAGRFINVHSPLQEAYEKIAARGQLLVG
jgi:hypothetical protein